MPHFQCVIGMHTSQGRQQLLETKIGTLVHGGKHHKNLPLRLLIRHQILENFQIPALKLKKQKTDVSAQSWHESL